MRSSAYLSADGIDGERRRRFMRRRGVFYFDTILLSFAYVVPFCSLFVRYEKRDGCLFVVPRPVICR